MTSEGDTKEQRARRLTGNLALDLGQLYSVFRIKLSWYALIKNESRPVSAIFYKLETREVDLEVTASLDEFKRFLDPLMSEITRNFINDIFNIACEFNIYLRNLLNGTSNIFEYGGDNIDGAIFFSNKFLSKEQKDFLDFLRLVRNTMVHHGGRYNRKNGFDHEFEGRRFRSTDDLIDQPVMFYLSDLIAFYKHCLRIFSFENFYKNEYFRTKLLQ